MMTGTGTLSPMATRSMATLEPEGQQGQQGQGMGRKPSHQSMAHAQSSSTLTKCMSRVHVTP